MSARDGLDRCGEALVQHAVVLESALDDVDLDLLAAPSADESCAHGQVAVPALEPQSSCDGPAVLPERQIHLGDQLVDPPLGCVREPAEALLLDLPRDPL